MRLKYFSIFLTLTLVVILGSLYYHGQKNISISENELDMEIAFYEKRINDVSPSYQDLTILSQLLVTKAKESGNEIYYQRAKNLAERSLKDMPIYNTSATYVLADIAQAHHQFKKSTDLAKIILKEKINSAEAYSILTTSFLATGDLKAALMSANKLFILAPTATSSALQAIILSQMGKYQEADKNFKVALLEIEDNKKEAAWTQTVYARFLIHRNEFAFADALIKKSLKIMPADSLSLHELGELREKQKKYPEAIEAYKSAFSSSRQIISLLSEARVLKKMGKLDLARSINEQAEVILKSDNTHTADLIRLLLEKDGPAENTEALKLARQEVKTRAGFETMNLLIQASLKNHRLDLAFQARNEMRKKGMVVEND